MKFPVLLLALGSLLLPARAQFTLIETGGTFRTDATNLAAASNGGTAFAQDLIHGDGYGVHFAGGVNDGVYGNASSWIGQGWSTYVGVLLASPVTLGSFAVGRDNTGVHTSRAENYYQFQYSTTAIAGFDAATATWTTIGTQFLDAGSGLPSPALRHLYDLPSPLAGVTAFRVRTAGEDTGLGQAVDEIELYAATPIPEPSTYAALAGLCALGLAGWRRTKRSGTRN